MDDVQENETVNEAVENEVDLGEEISNEDAQAICDGVDREYYSPDELENAGERISQVVNAAELAGKEITYGFDPENPEIEDGYGLAIIPQSKRVGGETQVFGFVVAAVPDPSRILSHENGSEYVRKLVIDSMLAKVANSSRERADGTKGTIPKTIVEFMERRSTGSGLKTYNELQKDFVKALRSRGLKQINASILRNCLQSQAYATEIYEQVNAEQWGKVLDTMIAKAQEKKLDPAILLQWKETREQVELHFSQDIDLDDLDDLLS